MVSRKELFYFPPRFQRVFAETAERAAVCFFPALSDADLAEMRVAVFLSWPAR
jgi:hypothetical protein